MLEVKQLTRRYGRFVAVDDVSFEIGKGEIVGLLGHNGAGKTTIMKMISGYLEPNQGDIRLGGYNLAKDTKTAQRLLGYLPESLPIYPEMTVIDYLDFAAELRGLAEQQKIDEVQRVLAATEIQSKALESIATLSRGFKQRVGVAQALLGKPKLLILDEPTNGLDPTQTEHMRSLIQILAKEATVILSTHIMQEVDALCDRVLILRNGQLVVDEKLKSLQQARGLLINTNAQLEAVKEPLQGISAVMNIEPIDRTSEKTSTEAEGLSYRVHLDQAFCHEKQSLNAVCADVAKALISHNIPLFAMTPETLDLEALFREVNQGATFTKNASKNRLKEAEHAA